MERLFHLAGLPRAEKSEPKVVIAASGVVAASLSRYLCNVSSTTATIQSAAASTCRAAESL
jgi:hypothetical protein